MNILIGASRRNLIFAVAFLALALQTGCDNGKRDLQRQLTEIATQADQTRRVISNEESSLAATRQRRNALSNELNEFNASVQGYILEHKMAVAAIAVGVGGTKTALDPNNAYSQDAKQLGAVLAVAAGLWAVGNMDEVSEVLKTMNQADAHVRGLESDIEQADAAIQQQQAALQDSQGRLSAQAEKTTTLQQRLQQL